LADRMSVVDPVRASALSAGRQVAAFEPIQLFTADLVTAERSRRTIEQEPRRRRDRPAWCAGRTERKEADP
jgi:hypothetical protein